jgi:hypothetical protein
MQILEETLYHTQCSRSSLAYGLTAIQKASRIPLEKLKKKFTLSHPSIVVAFRTPFMQKPRLHYAQFLVRHG